MPPRALHLPDRAAARVRDGHSVVRLDELTSAGPTLDAGRPLQLLDRHSETVGMAVVDAENGVLRILSREYEERFDVRFFHARARRARAWRERLGVPSAATTAYRLVHGAGDELPGFAVDVFSEFAVLYVASRGLKALGRELAAALIDDEALRGVVIKVRPRAVPKAGKLEQEVIGAQPPQELEVLESGVRYVIHPLGGLNVGLFTDMREHRLALRACSRGQRVLNLFSYTGSLSLVAALGGATSVTSVDLAAGVHAWAQKNFRLAGVDVDSGSGGAEGAFEFVTSDVIRFLERARADETRFDLILIDPPSFSQAKPSRWSAKSDYPKLMRLAADLLPAERGGILWLAMNSRSGPRLTKHLDAAFAGDARSCAVLSTGGLPVDYPTAVCEPSERYLQVTSVRIQPWC